jgi:flagellar hook-associated protein 3 FlgL
MAIGRVSDAQLFDALGRRTAGLQASLERLTEQIASGRRLLLPADDPIGATEVVRLEGLLANLTQRETSAAFGGTVLAAQEEVLGEAEALLVRAREIAVQQASGFPGPGERQVAAEEVHGLLQGLTALANSEFAGRRLFAGLALDGPPPFADPDSAGYTAAAAFTGSTQEFSIKIGADAIARVRVSTRGDAVFEDALVALGSLETALRTNGDVAAALAALAEGSATLAAERGSVAARVATLTGTNVHARAYAVEATAALSRVRDADLTVLATQLRQAQTALEATVAAGAQLAQTSLLSLLRL